MIYTKVAAAWFAGWLVAAVAKIGDMPAPATAWTANDVLNMGFFIGISMALGFMAGIEFTER